MQFMYIVHMRSVAIVRNAVSSDAAMSGDKSGDVSDQICLRVSG